jgi:hypothetical protein
MQTHHITLHTPVLLMSECLEVFSRVFCADSRLCTRVCEQVYDMTLVRSHLSTPPPHLMSSIMRRASAMVPASMPVPARVRECAHNNTRGCTTATHPLPPLTQQKSHFSLRSADVSGGLGIARVTLPRVGGVDECALCA